MMRPSSFALLACAAACFGLLQVSGQPTPPSWQAETTFYEIFVRSFKDSDGDGIGDFQGILSQLDHLNDGDPTTTTDLGIGGIWLMPINPSPSYHGYDVTDYFGVNSDYGTQADFEALVDECHARGIRVIVDFVGNHSSSQHPHFLASASGPGDPFRDWYVWSDSNPGGDWHGSANGWYYGLFWSGMPDWNVQNPDVVQYHYDIVDHWLGLGVDGFRYDAVKHLVNEGNTYENHPGTFAYLEAFRDHYQSTNPEAICVGEAWTSTNVIAQYGPPHLDMCFEFGLAGGILNAVNQGQAAPFRGALDAVLAEHVPGAYAPFLTNHDQDRTMSVLGGDVDKAKLAAAVLLTLPGTPFLYYGEEIGMTGAGSHPNVRTPMHWTGGSQAGFTTGTPWSAAQPDVNSVNVAAQTGDPNALLSTYREFIHLRNAEPALQRGETVTWDATFGEVGAHLRTLGEDRLLVVHNFSNAALNDVGVLPVGLCDGAYAVTDVRTGNSLGEADLMAGVNWALPAALGPRDTRVLRLESVVESEGCLVPLTLSVDQFLDNGPGVGHVRYRIDDGPETVVQMEYDGTQGWFSETLFVPEGATVRYRFQSSQIPSDVETVPPSCGTDSGAGFAERSVTVGASPVSVDRVCFGACSPCAYPPQQITLRVDLGDLTPHPDGVHVAGDFQGWDPAGTEMAPQGDGVYAHTLSLDVGETILYKFINGAAWGGLEEIELEGCGVPNGMGGWNRSLTVEPGTGVLPAVCFEACAPCTPPVSWGIESFSVDMSFVTEHPSGLFLEWNHPDSVPVPMQYGANGVWTAVATLIQGEPVQYRFRNGPDSESVPIACGGPEGWRVRIAGTANAEESVPCFAACVACALLGGCTYPAAVNYDAEALFDNGSCAYAGCTDATALNHHPLATVDDGTCFHSSILCGPGTVLDAFGQCVPLATCAGDVNADGLIGVADILLVLSVFGNACAP